MIIEKKGYWALFVFVLGFVLSRVFVSGILGVSPDPDYLVSHWQILALEDLNQSLFSTVLNAHSQPPVWNLLVGGAAKMCASDVDCVVNLIHMFNVTLTGLTCVILWFFLIEFGLARAVAVAAVSVYALLPSTIFYENYIFYPQFTQFLLAIILFFTYLHFKSFRITYLVFSFIAILTLSWTWNLFHPVLMVLVLLQIAFLSGNRWSRKAPIVAVFSLFLFLPAAKNQVLFDFFGNSSWLGLNVSQVAPETPPGCRFEDFRSSVKHVSHEGSAYNDVSIIPYSQSCEKKAITSILRDVDGYFRARIHQFLYSTHLAPSDYFFPPLGFEHYPRISGIPESSDGRDVINTSSSGSRLIIFLVNIISICLVLLAPFIMRRESVPFRNTFSVAAVFLLILLGVGHLANGGEQERMRYTANVVLYLAVVVFSSRIFTRMSIYRTALCKESKVKKPKDSINRRVKSVVK
ncbi:MAG: hypothetical protein ACWA44_15820 [Thiotrichales bacterium]